MPDYGQCLETVTLTGIINRLDPPARFLRDLMIARDVSLETETIEIGTVARGRKIAPFSPPGASALIVGKRDREMRQVTAPNIRIKCSLNPNDLMYFRDLGEQMYFTEGGGGGTFVSRLAQQLTEHLEDLNAMMTNTEEWMVSQLLGQFGQIAYTQPGEDVFTVSYGRPAGHYGTLGPGTWWNDPTSFPPKQFLDCPQQVARTEGLRVTHCLMPTDVVNEFLVNPVVQRLLDNRRIEIGNFDFMSKFMMDGAARYIGRFLDIDCWQYLEELDVNGATVPLLEPKHVHFIAAGQDNEVVMYYASIPDLDAMDGGHTTSSSVMGGRFVGPRFAKSWRTPDPTSHWVMAQSRPLPVPRRPGFSCTVQVLP